MIDIMAVRLANKEDLDQVNVLRKQVYDLHAQGKPSVFNPEFSEELRVISIQYGMILRKTSS